MATYIVYGNWTDEGIRKVKEAPARGRRAIQLAEQQGCKVVGVLVLMGEHDVALRVEAPDDAAIGRFALSMASWGTIRTKTVKAFTLEEFEQVVQALP
jgi:uncharacterized protein with GYD domain